MAMLGARGTLFGVQGVAPPTPAQLAHTHSKHSGCDAAADWAALCCQPCCLCRAPGCCYVLLVCASPTSVSWPGRVLLPLQLLPEHMHAFFGWFGGRAVPDSHMLYCHSLAYKRDGCLHSFCALTFFLGALSDCAGQPGHACLAAAGPPLSVLGYSFIVTVGVCNTSETSIPRSGRQEARHGTAACCVQGGLSANQQTP